MNNKSIENAKKMNQYLIHLPLIQEYKMYEKAIHDHEEIRLLEEEIKQLQKKIVNEKHHGNDAEELIHEYELKKECFETHPLVNNYLLLKEEVNQLLSEIQNYINKNING